LFDKRHFLWWWQRRTRGFDDRDTWSLDYTIAKFAAPRLRLFAQKTFSFPVGMTIEEWQAKIEGMAAALQWLVDNDGCTISDGFDEHKQGFEDFGEYFLHLWW
jgi:hypothetical protein